MTDVEHLMAEEDEVRAGHGVEIEDLKHQDVSRRGETSEEEVVDGEGGRGGVGGEGREDGIEGSGEKGRVENK